MEQFIAFCFTLLLFQNIDDTKTSRHNKRWKEYNPLWPSTKEPIIGCLKQGYKSTPLWVLCILTTKQVLCMLFVGKNHLFQHFNIKHLCTINSLMHTTQLKHHQHPLQNWDDKQKYLVLAQIISGWCSHTNSANSS